MSSSGGGSWDRGANLSKFDQLARPLISASPRYSAQRDDTRLSYMRQSSMASNPNVSPYARNRNNSLSAPLNLASEKEKPFLRRNVSPESDYRGISSKSMYRFGSNNGSNLGGPGDFASHSSRFSLLNPPSGQHKSSLLSSGASSTGPDGGVTSARRMAMYASADSGAFGAPNKRHRSPMASPLFDADGPGAPAESYKRPRLMMGSNSYHQSYSSYSRSASSSSNSRPFSQIPQSQHVGQPHRISTEGRYSSLSIMSAGRSTRDGGAGGGYTPYTSFSRVSSSYSTSPRRQSMSGDADTDRHFRSAADGGSPENTAVFEHTTTDDIVDRADASEPPSQSRRNSERLFEGSEKPLEEVPRTPEEVDFEGVVEEDIEIEGEDEEEELLQQIEEEDATASGKKIEPSKATHIVRKPFGTSSAASIDISAVCKKVLNENRAIAKEDFISAMDFLGSFNAQDSVRIYKRVEDYPCYEQILAKHVSLKPALIEFVAAQKAELADKIEDLREEYADSYANYKRKQAKMEKKRRFSANSSGGIAQHAGEVFGTRSSRRGTGASAFTSDAVKSEAEWEQVLAAIAATEQVEADDSKLMAQTVRIPAMILDPLERRIFNFQNNNRLVFDPAEELAASNALLESKWTEKERDLFCYKLVQYGKDFPKISACLGNKTTQDCVEYYYREKFSCNFKLLLRKAANSRANLRRRMNNLAKKANAKNLSNQSAQDSQGSAEQLSVVAEAETEVNTTVIQPAVETQLKPTAADTPAKSKPKSRQSQLQIEETSKFNVAGVADSARWTVDEKSRALQAFEQFGRNFLAISTAVGSKTILNCEDFYNSYKRKLNLDVIADRAEARIRGETQGESQQPQQSSKKKSGKRKEKKHVENEETMPPANAKEESDEAPSASHSKKRDETQVDSGEINSGTVNSVSEPAPVAQPNNSFNRSSYAFTPFNGWYEQMPQQYVTDYPGVSYLLTPYMDIRGPPIFRQSQGTAIPMSVITTGLRPIERLHQQPQQPSATSASTSTFMQNHPDSQLSVREVVITQPDYVFERTVLPSIRNLISD
ncbi:nuclear receptor corepressor 2 [Entophlyctis sp. JEL0112]|nr:nuclear receptor corepressor 2 [Entophlyctis sp. JEL0112]